MNIENLSENEYRILLESLLYSSLYPITSNWYKEEYDTIANLAIKLRSSYPNILCKNVEMDSSCNVGEDEFLQYFPELQTRI